MMEQKESIAEKLTDFTIELDRRSIFEVSRSSNEMAGKPTFPR